MVMQQPPLPSRFQGVFSQQILQATKPVIRIQAKELSHGKHTWEGNPQLFCIPTRILPDIPSKAVPTLRMKTPTGSVWVERCS